MISLPRFGISVPIAPIETPTANGTRRRFLSSITTGILGVIGGILGVLGGGAVLSSTVRRQQDWLTASALLDLPDNEPTAVTLSVMRLDGYRDVLQRRTIFLVKTGESEVVGFDATCTHLGCLVAWDRQTQVFRCPCHGGIFDRTGAVMDGPPPEPLAKIATRVDGTRVLVQA
ncbi:MAG: ubiquinol-cytochrome c reductase iron-sulfur subunit [Vicinamibacterales bacterium]